jgi:hypothetical protein
MLTKIKKDTVGNNFWEIMQINKENRMLFLAAV